MFPVDGHRDILSKRTQREDHTEEWTNNGNDNYHNINTSNKSVGIKPVL